MRRSRSLPMLLAVLGGLTACSGTDTPPRSAARGFPMTFDSCGRTVTIDTRPRTVLTMGTDAPTLVAAAGAADQIDVRAAEFGYPLGRYRDVLANIPLISPTQEPSKEVIIGTGADLAITYGLNNTSPRALGAVGIDIVTPSGRCDDSAGDTADSAIDFTDVYRDISRYGRLFGTEDQAAHTVRNLRARVAAVTRTSATSARTAAAVYFSGNSLGAYGGSSMADTQIEALGLTNVFADTGKRAFETSVEEFIARDPDVLIVLVGNTPGTTAEQVTRRLRALPGAETVTALRENRIVPVGYTYLGGGPLAVDGLEKMAGKLSTNP